MTSGTCPGAGVGGGVTPAARAGSADSIARAASAEGPAPGTNGPFHEVERIQVDVPIRVNHDCVADSNASSDGVFNAMPTPGATARRTGAPSSARATAAWSTTRTAGGTFETAGPCMRAPPRSMFSRTAERCAVKSAPISMRCSTATVDDGSFPSARVAP